jgi:hypothetical protein
MLYEQNRIFLTSVWSLGRVGVAIWPQPQLGTNFWPGCRILRENPTTPRQQNRTRPLLLRYLSQGNDETEPIQTSTDHLCEVYGDASIYRIYGNTAEFEKAAPVATWRARCCCHDMVVVPLAGGAVIVVLVGGDTIVVILPARCRRFCVWYYEIIAL